MLGGSLGVAVVSKVGAPGDPGPTLGPLGMLALLWTLLRSGGHFCEASLGMHIHHCWGNSQHISDA